MATQRMIWLICFNPRARDGRELCGSPMAALLQVSIHAPVMDAKDILRTQLDIINEPLAMTGYSKVGAE